MHRYTDQTEELAKAILSYTTRRLRMDPVPLDGPKSSAELTGSPARPSRRTDMGGAAALKLFGDVLAPACISVDHPRFLSFIPAAPTEASMLFDLVCGASSIYGGSWLEGAGAVYAENQALRFVADLVGLPAGAGGVFVPAARRATCPHWSPRATPRAAAATADYRGRWKVVAHAARRTPRSSTPPR